MHTRRLVSILAATGIALAAASCSSSDDGNGPSSTEGADNSVQQSAPQASPHQLLLNADEFPSGSEFTVLPTSGTDQVLENMKIPDGAQVDPPECADKATALTTLTGQGEVAATAGSAEGQTLLLADVVIKNGPSVAEVRTANERCPKSTYTGDNVVSTGATDIGDAVQVDGASDAVEYTSTSETTVAGTTVSTGQYGIAAEVNGVVLLVTVTSMNDSGKVSPEIESQVLDVANAQAVKISKAD